MKGVTNASRGPFAKAIVVNVDNSSLPTLNMKITYDGTSATTQTLISCDVRHNLGTTEDNTIYDIHQWTQKSYGTSAKIFYDHMSTKLAESSINLNGIISTNLPEGSTINIQVFGRNGVSGYYGAFLFEMIGTIGSDGVPRVTVPTTSFKLFDKTSSKGTRATDVCYLVSEILSIGGGTN